MPIQNSGPQRHQLPTQRAEDMQAIEAMRASGALVIDDRRRRPNYFDGRFLTARDLTREQTYFLTRQSDLGRATGPGVVRGLMVELESQPGGEQLLRIAAGHGLTASGELVLLAEELRLRLSDIPEIERLNARFGLSRVPGAPVRNRTGAFLLALRPVEFTANPIASYPTSITGSRTVENSDIIEAVAVTLMPYGESGGLSPLQRQAQLARDIFVLNRQGGAPVDALPLALIYLERNQIEWVDPFLVRREVGADRADVLGLGFAPRAVREAHLIQYRRQLQTVQTQRAAASQGQRFAAAEHFQALPPAGQLPKAAINPADFTQVFFPAEIAVDLAIIPEDELAALVEESFLLPPIDLAAGTEALESTSVVVLLPVARASFRALKATLGGEGALPDSPLVRALRPAVPTLLARSRPLEILTNLRLARREQLGLPDPQTPASPIDIAWQQALAEPQTQLLWYTRRRNMAYYAAVTGVPLPLASDPPPPDPGEGGEPGEGGDPLAFLDPLNLRTPYLALSDYLTGDQMTAVRQTLQATPLTAVKIGDLAPFGYILLAQINRSAKSSGNAVSTALLAALLGDYVAVGANGRKPLLNVFKANPDVAGLLAKSSRAFELLRRIPAMSKAQYTGASSLLSKVGNAKELAEAISTIMGDIVPPLPDM
ncbi:MAG TPA: hypothetical protein VFS21_22105 [Roseiflexaceae bacterium]|nr:hypothetical protein [Roseiflexaceae bacterium]